jgi:AcrR family transcriptional regulator
MKTVVNADVRRSAQRTTRGPASTSAPQSPWPARRRRGHAIKREAVIRAAARAFNAAGYHNTSLDDIAAALHVTKPTIYYYVENKEQLLFQCFLAGLEPINAALRAAAALRLPARERLAAVLRDYARAIASEYGWCMVRAADQDLSREMRAHIQALKSGIDQGIRRLIRDGIEDGSIQRCDPKMTAFAIAGALNWIAHWYRENQQLNADQIAESFLRIFEHGLTPREVAQGADASIHGGSSR